MPDTVIPIPGTVMVPVSNSETFFPVRRIYCVAKNYSAHIREMGGDEREPPFFFQKPRDAIVLSGSEVKYPKLTSDFHHEIELVIAIGTAGENIKAEDAADHVYGLAVGIDFTRRDLQHAAKKAGKPWEIAKAFDHSAPISEIVALDEAALPTSGAIALSVNGEIKQFANISDMTWDCAEVISTLSTHFKLEAGDLIYTGTPAGVGPLVPGDSILGSIDGLPDLQVKITERSNT
ncbi:MAG: FAA hydrolase family protein [Desulfobulbaceae bacterium]|nr:FAA hydrolase family protein [Desulfobulbaceae bacterium]